MNDSVRKQIMNLQSSSAYKEFSAEEGYKYVPCMIDMEYDYVSERKWAIHYYDLTRPVLVEVNSLNKKQMFVSVIGYRNYSEDIIVNNCMVETFYIVKSLLDTSDQKFLDSL